MQTLKHTKTKGYVGKHRQVDPQDSTAVNNDLNRRFQNGDELAAREKERLVFGTTGQDPFDKQPERRHQRGHNRIRRAAAAALLAVGVMNPNTMGQTPHPADTAAVSVANPHTPDLDFGGMVADVAGLEAVHNPAISNEAHIHTVPLTHPTETPPISLHNQTPHQ